MVLPQHFACSVRFQIRQELFRKLLLGHLVLWFWVTLKRSKHDAFTERSILWWHHEFNLGVIGIAGAQHHAVRWKTYQIATLEVAQHEDVTARQIFRAVEGSQPRSNLTRTALFTQINFFAEQLFGIWMMPCLEDFTDANVEGGNIQRSSGSRWHWSFFLGCLFSSLFSALVGSYLLLFFRHTGFVTSSSSRFATSSRSGSRSSLLTKSDKFFRTVEKCR
mmetsp:Transcript_5456/g.8970  ORF Transcript_5456/g.8970 Transcript_5456/m.8970 type:complete len:220 (+) Transcript_5456:155-814(+)